jgi:hypothetical protein
MEGFAAGGMMNRRERERCPGRVFVYGFVTGAR